MKKSKKRDKSLILTDLAKFSQDVLFPALDKRFENIDKRFDNIDKRFENIDKRFDKMEQSFATKDYLIKYTREILIPELEERFVTRKEFNEFKNEIMANFEIVFAKLDSLMQERTFDEFLKDNNRELWKIAVKAMKKHEILTSKELQEVKMLGIF